jgi:hypothetical protein
MPNITPAVDKIFGNEKAIALYEMHLQSPGSKGFHRYQIIHVPRNGVVCEWRKDMGLAKNFRGISQLRIPSYMEHTVDELKAIANEMRVTKFDVKDFLELNDYIPG